MIVKCLTLFIRVFIVRNITIEMVSKEGDEQLQTGTFVGTKMEIYIGYSIWRITLSKSV